MFRPNRVIAATFFITELTSRWFALAYDARKRDCDDLLCLTSFVWCATGSSVDAGQTGCSYPDDAYPYFDRETPSNPALLLARSTYNLTWKNAQEGYPVLVRWSFQGAYSTNTARPRWEMSKTTKRSDTQLVHF